MTDEQTPDEQQPGQCAASDREYNTAALQPCKECPWRRENADRPAPEPFEDSYTEVHHVRCWRDVAAGAISICHVTAPAEDFPQGSDPRWIGAGFKPVPEHAQARECAGSVAAALREVRRIMTYPSLNAYVEANPQGMRRESAVRWLRRVLAMEGTMEPHPDDADWPSLRRPMIDSEAVIDPATEYDIDGWALKRPEEIDSLLDALKHVMSEHLTGGE